VKFFGLRWKIIGALIISNLILGLIIVFIVNNKVKESLTTELIERGRTIASNLSSYSAEQILAGDKEGLRQLISRGQNFESVGYRLIHDSEGEIIADTFNGDVPEELRLVDIINRENYIETEAIDVTVLVPYRD